MRKDDFTMMPLRIFLGIQCIGFGIFSLITSYDFVPVVFQPDQGCVWSWTIVIGGVGLLLSSIAIPMLAKERERLNGSRKGIRHMAYVLTARVSPLVFHFNIALWSGYWYSTAKFGVLVFSEYLAFTTVAALVYVAYKDAYRKRKRVIENYEARQTAVPLHPRNDSTSGVRS
jgi:hypothetical protein